jgi:capsular polysaccharide biosynthesis protein
MNGIEAVNPIDEAKLPTSPSSPNVEKNTMIGFMIGFALSILVVAVMFILDDTIKTPDDIEKRLGVSVLASIPLKSVEHHSASKTDKTPEKNRKKAKNKKDTQGKE